MLTRRDFLATACAAGAGVRPGDSADTPRPLSGPICLFSKHLPELNWADLARATKDLGFDGIDLTVRKGGHVLPEQAPVNLPKAVTAIHDGGLTVPMITTDLQEDNEVARAVVSTAGKLEIPFMKPGYYHYRFVDVRRELETAGAQFRGLAAIARQHGVQVGFHNHAGYIGAPIWDIARILDAVDPQSAGYYFDVCHAVTEGGVGGWKIALNLVSTRIKMIAVKDFYWEKTNSGWKPRMCPLGQGMVSWPEFFQALCRAGFAGPVSLHLEYDLPGSTAPARRESTLAAASRDLGFLRKSLEACRA